MLAVLVLLGAAALAGVAQPHAARSAELPAGRTITVTGNGSVETVPDRTTFSFTVATTAGDAKDALAKNSSAAAAVAAALKGAAVQTSNVSLDRRTDRDGNVVAGYVATTTLTADAPLTAAGALIDAAVAAGATSFSGPAFSRSDQDALYRDALQAAVADAKTKAAAVASASGLALGPVESVVEGSSAPPLPFAAGDVAKIEPGTQTVNATVTVTYAAG